MIWRTKNELSKPVSVKYCGPFLDFTGYGEANRNAIMALHTVGVEVTTEKVEYASGNADFGEAAELAQRLEGRPIKYDIKIVHVPSDGYMKFLEPAKYHIGHLFWETDSISKTWVWNCNLMDEIWTGGQIHKENFRRAGVKVPIHVFPQAIDNVIQVQKPFRVTDHKGYMFYSIFQWIERKNPKALLKAYWEEFQGEDNVSLLLKVYRFGFDKSEREQIRKDINDWKEEFGHKHFPKIFLFFDLVDKSDMFRIHYTGDCFVSAHRGEGWGIPQAEAAVIGNPIISTGLGGVHEWFEDEKSAFLTKWKRTKVKNMDFAPWYEKNQHWAEVDHADLKKRMRFVFDNPEEAKKVGNMAKDVAYNKLSYKAVGEAMRDRLVDIQRLIK